MFHRMGLSKSIFTHFTISKADNIIHSTEDHRTEDFVTLKFIKPRIIKYTEIKYTEIKFLVFLG